MRRTTRAAVSRDGIHDRYDPRWKLDDGLGQRKSEPSQRLRRQELSNQPILAAGHKG
jgi:hypothetical protein